MAKKDKKNIYKDEDSIYISWSEDKALQLGNELIAWLKKSKYNVYFESFILENTDFSTKMLRYLKEKYKSFGRLYSRAREIQKFKLLDLPLKDKEINWQCARFSLINNHGMKNENNKTDASEVENVRERVNITIK